MVVNWLGAILLWVSAVVCAGITGMSFEESMIHKKDKQFRSAIGYAVRGGFMGTVALTTAYVGVCLVI